MSEDCSLALQDPFVRVPRTDLSDICISDSQASAATTYYQLIVNEHVPSGCVNGPDPDNHN